MGNYNCCGRYVRLNENEAKLIQTPRNKEETTTAADKSKAGLINNSERVNNHTIQDDDNSGEIEKLETFELTFENILNYFNQGDMPLPRVDAVTREELDHAVSIKGKSDLLVINKKFVVKVINPEDGKNTNFKNLKEIRIIKKYMNRNYFITKCSGYFLDEDVEKASKLNRTSDETAIHLGNNSKSNSSNNVNSKAKSPILKPKDNDENVSHFNSQSSKLIYLKYDYYENSLGNFIKYKSADFKNKIRLFKTLIEMVKKLHSEGIVSSDLSINNIRFTPKYHLKLVNFGNSFDFNSNMDIDRLSQFDHITPDLHYAPEILLLNEERKNNLKSDEHCNKTITWSCDIWSLGIILLMLFSDDLIKIPADELISDLKEGRLHHVINESLDKVSDVYIKSLIIGMLRIEPEERPSIFNIVDNFNKYVEKMKYEQEYTIPTIKNETYEFVRIFQSSSFIVNENKIMRVPNKQIERNLHKDSTRSHQ